MPSAPMDFEGWCIYTSTRGEQVVKHPYRPGDQVPCPECGAPLQVASYRASCCGEDYRVGWSEIARLRRMGAAPPGTVRGWRGLRPYRGERPDYPFSEGP